MYRLMQWRSNYCYWYIVTSASHLAKIVTVNINFKYNRYTMQQQNERAVHLTKGGDEVGLFSGSYQL
jgi:hypothetical protein